MILCVPTASTTPSLTQNCICWYLMYICYISVVYVVWCCMNLNICLTCSNSATSIVTRWGWCVSSEETWLRAISPWALTPTNRMRLNNTILSRARANLTPQIKELGWKTNILCVERWLVTARSHAALRCSVKFITERPSCAKIQHPPYSSAINIEN